MPFFTIHLYTMESNILLLVCNPTGEIMQSKLFSIYQDGVTVNVYDGYIKGFVTFEIKGEQAIVQAVDLYDAVRVIKIGDNHILDDMWSCKGFKTLLESHGLI